jgi:hypothetical protein
MMRNSLFENTQAESIRMTLPQSLFAEAQTVSE